MRKWIQRGYLVFLALYTVLFIFLLFHFRLDISQRENKPGYETLEEFTIRTIPNENAPLGFEQEYDVTISGLQDSYRELMFYTIHQNVRIYSGGKCIYSMEPSPDTLFGRTPGCVWNDLTLTEAEEGRSLRILITPVYESSVDYVPQFLLGNRYDIVRDTLLQSSPSLFLSVAAILIGIFFIAFVIYNHKNSELDRSLAMLGIFSVLIGIWKLTDSSAADMLTTKYPAFSLMPFMALMLAIIPFMIFIREMHQSRKSRIWDIPCAVSLLNLMAVLVCQLLNILDFRQTIYFTHFTMLVLVLVTCYMVFREIRQGGWNAKLRRNFYCMLICFLGLVLDLMTYYSSHGEAMAVFGMLGFMTYILVLGLASMKEARQLMTIGMRAKRYEQMAYHDQLTGLFNRTAYAEHIGSDDFMPDHCIVAVFDLNDLKKANDTLGHDKGDVYIKECANMIQEAFGDIGKCYRMGGDEFCVLISGSTLEECRGRIRQLKEKVQKRSEELHNIRMGIACGIELYDKRVDYDIGDTSRRADKQMYHEKFTMKQQMDET